MDLDARFWLDLVQFILTAAIGVYAWQVARQRALREATETQLLDHERRLTLIEEKARHMPSGDSINRLSERLGDLHGDLQRMVGEFTGWQHEMKSLRTSVQLLVDNELRGGRQ